jgi:hypothetical protein
MFSPVARLGRALARGRHPGGFQPRGARRLAGGRSLVAVALEDSVQMLLELPPTREPTPSLRVRRRPFPIDEPGGSVGIEAS